MSEKLKISPQFAAEEIRKERYPEAKVVFLAGSVVRGEGTPHSDLDLVVLFEKLPAAFRESFFHKGWPVEVFAHDPETLKFFFLDENRKSGVAALIQMVLEGQELPTASDFSRAMKKMAGDALAMGPVLLTEAQLQRMRYVITDLCDDLRAPRNAEELVATAARLHEVFADFYLRAQGKWSGKGKSIPRKLKEADPAFAVQVQRAFTSAFKDLKTEELLALVEATLKPYGGVYFAGARSDAPVDWRMG